MAISRKKIKLFLQALGPIIFIYILSKIDYGIILKQIKLLKWYLLLIAILVMILEIIVRSLKWRTILSSLDIQVAKIKSVSLYWLGAFVGIVTPGRIGELAKVYFLRNKGHSAFRSFFSIIFDRLIDILTLLFLSLLIFLLFFRAIGSYFLIIGGITILLSLLVILMIDSRSWLHKFFSRIIRKVSPVNLDDYNHFTFGKLWQGIKFLKKRHIIQFFIYVCASWLLYFISRYVIALSLGLNLSFISVIIISVSVALVTILPISVAGIGTREASVIFLFSFFGLSKEMAVIFSLLIFTTDIISVSFGLIPYLKESSLINKFKAYESK